MELTRCPACHPPLAAKRHKNVAHGISKEWNQPQGPSGAKEWFSHTLKLPPGMTVLQGAASQDLFCAARQHPASVQARLLCAILCTSAIVALHMKPVIIKKYGNRRLYDTTGSRYVNLDDIAALVRAGKEVRVEDDKTGQDLTRVTLTQIITEDAKQKPTGLPLELLRQLILASDQAGQEFIMWYLKSAFDTYKAVQGAVQHRMGDMQSALLSPVESVKRFLNPASDKADKEELNSLRRRMAELEARQKKPRPRKRRRAPKAQK